MSRAAANQRAPTAADQRAPAAGSWAFAGYGYALLVLFAGSNAPSPLYRGYSQRFGFTPLTITVIFSAYMAAIIPSLLVFGPLSDAVGRRRVLVPGLALAAVGAGLFALARGTGWLFAARGVQGVSMGICSGALTAAMAEHEPHGDRQRAAAVATACIVAGAGGGPLLAGVLAQYAPWPRTLVFLIVIMALAPALVAIGRIGGPTGTRRRWQPRRPQARV